MKEAVHREFCFKSPEGTLKWDYEKMFRVLRSTHLKAKLNEDKVLEFVKTQTMVTTREVSRKCGICLGYSSEVLNHLVRDGKIKKSQRGVFKGVVKDGQS